MGISSLRALALFCPLLALWAPPASAAAPGDWSVAVERLFGVTRTSIEGEPESETTISVLSKVTGGFGYSAPRLAIDYIAGAGFTLGGALGVKFEGEQDAAWLLAPRIGYFARASSGFALWPRAGVTFVLLDYGPYSDDLTALTLEVPLEFLLSGRLALSLTPHADIGIGASSRDEDASTVTELGLQFGVGAFF